jgi:hypothetical protein
LLPASSTDCWQMRNRCSPAGARSLPDRITVIHITTKFRDAEEPELLSQYTDWTTGWTTGVRFPAEAGNFSLRHRVKICSGVWDPTSGGKATGAWSWPLTSS